MLGVRDQQTAPLQQTHDAPTQAVKQPDNVFPLRAPGAVKYSPAPPKRIGPVQKQHVQMRVEVERRAEPLDKGNGARSGAGGHG
jgi:hypothetical protein